MSLKNAGIIRKILKEEGFSEYGIRGSLARLRQESNLNPKALRKNDAGPGKHSRGILQWNRKRLAALQKFGGNKWEDIATQARFYAKELKGEIKGSDESKYGLRLKNAKSDEEAARAAISVARPRDWTPQNPERGHGFKNTLNWTKNWAAKQAGESTQYAGDPDSDPSLRPSNMLNESNPAQADAMRGTGMLSEEAGNMIPSEAMRVLDMAFSEDESLLGPDSEEIDDSPGAVASQTFRGLVEAFSVGAKEAGEQTPEVGMNSLFKSKILGGSHGAPTTTQILRMIRGMV